MGDVISTMNKMSDTEWAFTLNQPQGFDPRAAPGPIFGRRLGILLAACLSSHTYILKGQAHVYSLPLSYIQQD